MFPIDASSIDKSLPVPVGTQLHGLLSYTLASGDIAPNTRLPSVRQLAGQLGISPMTVAQVYKQLRDAGLVEMRQGLGAFTADAPGATRNSALPINLLRKDITDLVEKAETLGVSTMTLVSMINAQAQLPRNRAELDVVFVCIFEEPGRDYVEQIKLVLDPADRIRLVTLDGLQNSDQVRQTCRQADLVLTFFQRAAEVKALIETPNVLGLRFIPSEQTRQNLARLDPRARVAAVTQLQEYIAIMRPSVREFAPHVSDIRVTWSSAPDLDATLDACNVVIFATGADHVADHVAPGVTCFEYRHAPDPAALEATLIPKLAVLRSQRARKQSRTRNVAPGNGAATNATQASVTTR